MSYTLLSAELKEEINQTLSLLYTSRLSNAQTCLNDLIRKVETQLGPHSATTLKLTKKFMFDLKNYESKTEALWFLNERITRWPHATFDTFLLTQSIHPCDQDDQFLFLLNEENPFKLFINQVLMAYWYEQRHQTSVLTIPFKPLIHATLRQITKLDSHDEEDLYYFSYGLIELAILSRLQGQAPIAIYYLRKALDIVQKHTMDLELGITIYYFLFKYASPRRLKTYAHDFSMMMEWMERLMTSSTVAILYDFKLVRQAFLQLLNVKHYFHVSQDDIQSLGKNLVTVFLTRYELDTYYWDIRLETNMIHIYEFFKQTPEFNRLRTIPDFMFLIIHLLTIHPDPVSKRILIEVLQNISHLKEQTKHDQTTKITAHRLLSRLFHRRRMDIYEEICLRESLRLHLLLYGKTHHRVIDPRKRLAISLLKQNKTTEGKTQMGLAIQHYSQIIPSTWIHTKKGKEMISYLKL